MGTSKLHRILAVEWPFEGLDLPEDFILAVPMKPDKTLQENVNEALFRQYGYEGKATSFRTVIDGDFHFQANAHGSWKPYHIIHAGLHAFGIYSARWGRYSATIKSLKAPDTTQTVEMAGPAGSWPEAFDRIRAFMRLHRLLTPDEESKLS